ncbi:type II CRISPR RNA-guided endonuclease Cas9 [Terriglobus albidus]|uniref:type II CRISPR RNA-guided endonuclease Cas9 n=1 Tax=Terriglobus albidus TaxID=1592106 RepID=UPI0021DF60A3|nr:type II CRISPR RNA-guided endonuclease Cas9 [Terriglobus albidus]
MTASCVPTQKYVLGLDLGCASLGWALTGMNETSQPTHLIRTGVRIFQPGIEGTLSDIAVGKDLPKAVPRRLARLRRRQYRRRTARQRDLFRLLQRHGLLPVLEGENRGLSPSEIRHKLFNLLDKEIEERWSTESDDPEFLELPLYHLRQVALDQKLRPFEVGRVIYHLGQRRGFRSSRREVAQNAEQEKLQSKARADIARLEAAIEKSGARTLGEYFARLNPHEPGQNVRRRWTSRRMYEDEFALIWRTQAGYHPDLLAEELHDEVRALLFFQRPTAAQKHLIGRCELEPQERRVAWATLDAQRFRVLQELNGLEVVSPGMSNRKLAMWEHQIVFDLLERGGDQTFANLRKQLRLAKGCFFNLEQEGRRTLPGNHTASAMWAAFGERWMAFQDKERLGIVEEWRNRVSDEWLLKRGIDRWGLSSEAASRWSSSHPERGYCSFSRKALLKLLPLMFEGKTFSDAVGEAYGSRLVGERQQDRLPIVSQYLPALRNPALERALTEMRKVVNAIIREYGRPDAVHIELARELKQPRQERMRMAALSRKRRNERYRIKARILSECGIPIEKQTREDIEKALLYVECNGICPYTGRVIPFSSLFRDCQFDAVHIIPRCLYPDDSFQNRTLCYIPTHNKRNKTPFEAYGSDELGWASILERVRSFGNFRKLERFLLQTVDDVAKFAEKRLTDTHHSSVLAGRLLNTLYGTDIHGNNDRSQQKVFVSSGAVTATLRRSWGLDEMFSKIANPIKDNEKAKSRYDHRHHAIDAIVVALTWQGVVGKITHTTSSGLGHPPNKGLTGTDLPWNDFLNSVRPHITHIFVSHRPEHKMSGALHESTIYSPPYLSDNKKYVHVRKPISSLTLKEIDSIVDPAVRSAVTDKAHSVGDLSKCEGASDWPVLIARGGREIPIKRVRIRKALDVTTIGTDERQRNVALSNNHHCAIFAQIENDCEVRWEGITVSLYEAMQRCRNGMPVVETKHTGGEQWIFKFSLMNRDALEIHRSCDHPEGKCVPEIFCVRSIASNGQLGLVGLADGRLIHEIKSSRQFWSPRAETLRKLGAAKVVVDPLCRKHEIRRPS